LIWWQFDVVIFSLVMFVFFLLTLLLLDVFRVYI
jgi:hypothetical protein